ncbi:MAG: methionyl-tRNA formyltransferase [Elusimicrobia bacterium]|nr:methionyl-tRNA formyltransferase [Elusimicrobiota bacterium]
MKPRCVFVGAVEFSARCLAVLLDSPLEVAGILCPRNAGNNSDYRDLADVATRHRKQVRYFERIADERDYLAAARCDLLFVLGLSQIVPRDILKLPKVGSIGSHPALLPANRGRHPIIWAIANGLSESGLTFFWLDESVDGGDIWKQRPFTISPEDDAGSVYERVCDLGAAMLQEGVPELARGIYTRTPQDHSRANSWRKRTAADGLIDWRMSSRRIHDLVRALARPYGGALCRFRGADIRIWKTRIAQDAPRQDNIEPGQVLEARPGLFRVKTGDAALDILEHEFPETPSKGEYIL